MWLVQVKLYISTTRTVLYLKLCEAVRYISTTRTVLYLKLCEVVRYINLHGFEKNKMTCKSRVTNNHVASTSKTIHIYNQNSFISETF